MKSQIIKLSPLLKIGLINLIMFHTENCLMWGPCRQVFICLSSLKVKIVTEFYHLYKLKSLKIPKLKVLKKKINIYIYMYI